MLNLLSEETRRDPYPVYDQMRSASPVLHVPGADLYLIFDYESVKRALHDHDTFSSRAAPNGDQPLDWLIFLDPPRHAKLRAIVQKAFSPRVVASLEPRIRELARELLDRVVERGEMDLCADFSVPLPLMVIAEMIGIPIEDRAVFHRWSEAVTALSDTVSGDREAAARAIEASRAATAEMKTYLAGLVEARRSAPQDDLLTRLVEAEVDGEKLTEAELLDFFRLLLAAGSETTTNLIGNAVLCFLEHPGELAKLKAYPDLLPSTIEEVLRYRAPVQAMFRKTRRDIELSGQPIPAGKLVLPLIGAANRDPAQFSEAGRFDITRDPNPHLAFGNGIHFCLGAPLARLEARIAIPEIVARLPGLSLAGTWEPRKVFHLHGPTRLPIRFEPSARSR